MDSVGGVERDPSGGPTGIFVRLKSWPNRLLGTALEYADHLEAEAVFDCLTDYPLTSHIIGKPLCYQNNFVAYERCSLSTYEHLLAQSFPIDETYYTLRVAISAMMDLHASWIGGLPPLVSDFVRTEDKNKSCKLYYASATKRDCATYSQWEAIVREDYQRMESFARKLIEEPTNSQSLMKSQSLFDHFLIVLRDYSNKSFQDKQKHRLLVLGHPLLMNYNQVERFLQRRVVTDALRSIPSTNWEARVDDADDDRYKQCLIAWTKLDGWHSQFAEYCRYMITHRNDYNLYEPGFSREGMIQQFEVFYPSYLGLMWAALEERGVCPNLM